MERNEQLKYCCPALENCFISKFKAKINPIKTKEIQTKAEKSKWNHRNSNITIKTEQKKKRKGLKQEKFPMVKVNHVSGSKQIEVA